MRMLRPVIPILFFLPLGGCDSDNGPEPSSPITPRGIRHGVGGLYIQGGGPNQDGDVLLGILKGDDINGDAFDDVFLSIARNTGQKGFILAGRADSSPFSFEELVAGTRIYQIAFDPWATTIKAADINGDTIPD